MILALLGTSTAVYVAKRRARSSRIEPGSAGRAVIATNLVASRRR